MALMKLNVEWDNLPSKVDYLRFWNEDRFGKIPGITMSSMLFCKHGGLITPVTHGQLDDKLDMILCKNLNELTDEELRYLGYLFQIGDENVRLTIFDYLYLPPLVLDGESYSESWLKSNIWWLNNKKLPEVAEKYLAAINELKINNQGYNVETLISLLSWNQDKIDETYKKCMQYSIESGILISPKLALSIIIAEGTGSYDTNSAVAKSSYYGKQNGPQPDFELDTELGLGIINDKLSGFIVYKDDYLAKWPNRNEEESHLLQYLCDETPKLGKNMAGVYATARDGWISVVNEKYQFYNKETEDDKRDYIKDYETILEGYDKDLMKNSDTVQYEFIYDGSKVVAK